MRPPDVSRIRYRDLINDPEVHIPQSGQALSDSWVSDYNMFRPQMSPRSRTLYGFGDSCDV